MRVGSKPGCKVTLINPRTVLVHTMGLVAVSAGVAGGGGTVIDTIATVGPGIGGIFISMILVYLFAYLTLFDAADIDRPGLRNHLIAVVIPFFIAFSAILLYQSVQYV